MGAEPMRETWPDYRAVGPRYFETTRIPLLAGRDFDERDFEPGARSVIVNQELARLLWGGPREAIGKRMRRSWQRAFLTVVGVAFDVRTRLDRPGRPGSIRSRSCGGAEPRSPTDDGVPSLEGNGSSGVE